MPFGTFRGNEQYIVAPSSTTAPTIFNISSLRFLYDGDSLGDSPITAWPDSSSQGQNFTSMTSQATQFPSGVSDRLTVGVTGTHLQSDVVPGWDGLPGASLYMVANWASAGTAGVFLSTDGVKMESTATPTLGARVTSDTATGTVSTGTGVSFSNHFAILELIVDLSLGSDDIKFWNHEFNVSTGELISSNSAFGTLAGSTIDNPVDGLAYKDDVNDGLTASTRPNQICFIIGFNAALTTIERNIVLSFLQTQMGLDGTLTA